MPKKILIILLIFAIIIVGVFLFWLFSAKPTQLVTPTNQTKDSNLPPSGGKSEVNFNKELEGIKGVELTEEQKTIADLTRFAATFVERFGSFSNESDYENLRDLEVFMTVAMQNWTEGYIKDKLKENELVSSDYYGITTKALATKIIDFIADKEANISVSTQRQESTGSTKNSKVYYQDILLNLVKVENEWKIDAVYWQ